jgi:DNA-directed RNA polymerase II subunit RPB1
MSGKRYAKIEGIQFGVMNPDFIRAGSVAQVHYPEIFEDGNSQRPKANGLFDQKMGPMEEKIPCVTCGYKRDKCNGHFGHIELGSPVYHPGFIEDVSLVLRCICHCCSRLLVDKADIKHKKLKYVAALSKKKKYQICGNNESESETAENTEIDEELTVDTEIQDMTEVQQDTDFLTTLDKGGCGARQYNFVKEGIHIYCYKPKKKQEEDPQPKTGSKGRTRRENYTREEVTPLKAFRILEKITARDAQYLGFTELAHPSHLIISVLPVPPPCVRPSVLMDGSRRGEDDLTQKLVDIIKSNNSYIQYKGDQAAAEYLSELFELLQFHVATYIDNEIPNVPRSQQRSGRDIKGINQRLKGKEGRVRQYCMGKRVNQSARTVIGPEVGIKCEELGVPLKIAMTCSFKETVNQYNKDWLMKFVRNGPYKYPGANSITKIGPNGEEEEYLLRTNKDPTVLNLQPGDLVERHLIDGDPVVFNRQPTLHRPSMMGHRVRVMRNAKSFRLNLACTTPYNGKFAVKRHLLY